MSDGSAQEVSTFVDARDEVVRLGDTVAYAIRWGNSADLKIGKVEKIVYREFATYYNKWRITVRAKGGSKPSVLWFPDRIVKLPEITSVG